MADQDPPGDGPESDASPSQEAATAEAPPENALHRRTRLAEERLAQILDAYKEMRAETEALRDRTAKNVERRFEQRRERLLLRFIDILDNLDRALEAAELTSTGEQMIEGLILVRSLLLQTLHDEGLERIAAVGHPYDPNVSEAVATEPVADSEKDHVVIRELQRGYRLGGRLVRPSRVVVGAYGVSGDEGESQNT